MIWGTAVMAVSGIYLWLDDLVLRWFPKWMADVATLRPEHGAESGPARRRRFKTFHF